MLRQVNIIYCIQIAILLMSCLSCGSQHFSSLMAANAVSAGQQIKPKHMAQLGKPVIFQMEFVVRTRHGVERRTELIQGILNGFEPSGGSVGAVYSTTYEHGGTGIFRSDDRRLEINSVVPAALDMGKEGRYRILSGEAYTARIYFSDGTIRRISHQELRRPESLIKYGFQLISWEHHRISGKSIL